MDEQQNDRQRTHVMCIYSYNYVNMITSNWLPSYYTGSLAMLINDDKKCAYILDREFDCAI